MDEAATPKIERVVEEYKEPEVLKERRINQKRKSSEIKKNRGSKFDFWNKLMVDTGMMTWLLQLESIDS